MLNIMFNFQQKVLIGMLPLNCKTITSQSIKTENRVHQNLGRSLQVFDRPISILIKGFVSVYLDCFVTVLAPLTVISFWAVYFD